MSEEDDKKSPWWVSAINRLGLPTALLVCILFMLWRAGVWTADNVALPLVRKQIEFIESASKASEVAAAANIEMALITSDIRDTMVGQQAHGDHATDELKLLVVSVEQARSQSKLNGELLAENALNHQKSLETLKSIDNTLKSQQETLKSIAEMPN